MDRARQAQIQPAWPRSGLSGRAQGLLPPRPRRPPHCGHHRQQAVGPRRPTAGAVAPAVPARSLARPQNRSPTRGKGPCRRRCSDRAFARRRPLATAREGEKVEGGRWSRGFGAARAAPRESDAGEDDCFLTKPEVLLGIIVSQPCLLVPQILLCRHDDFIKYSTYT
jgi:hypothetical protein